MPIKKLLTKELSLSEALRCVLGGYRPMFFSKRLAPPLAVCNGRLMVGGNVIMEGDIDIVQYRKNLAMTARAFGVVLELKHESCDDTLWRSDHEDEWFGFCVNECGETIDAPQDFYAVLPWYKKEAAKQQKQWAIDHGLIVRRSKSKKRKSKS